MLDTYIVPVVLLASGLAVWIGTELSYRRIRQQHRIAVETAHELAKMLVVALEDEYDTKARHTTMPPFSIYVRDTLPALDKRLPNALHFAVYSAASARVMRRIAERKERVA